MDSSVGYLIRRVYGTLICDMSLWHYGDGGISEGSTAEGDGSELVRFLGMEQSVRNPAEALSVPVDSTTRLPLRFACAAT